MSEPVSYRKPTVRDVASVTLSSPVDGTSRRRRGAVAHGARRLRVVDPYSITVRDDVWAEAKRLCLPTQRIVIESATSVLIVNRERNNPC